MEGDFTLGTGLLSLAENSHVPAISRTLDMGVTSAGAIRISAVILISTSKNPCSFLLLLILSLQQN
jgi:hypothetical protein